MSELAALNAGLERHRAIQKISTVGLEGLALSALFRYAKIKGNVLFFVFKHQSAKFEFEYKKENIKTKMRGYYSTFSKELKANGVIFTDIRAVVITAPKQEVQKPKPLIYSERSTGNFEIGCHDPKLRELFASIQQTIKERV